MKRFVWLASYPKSGNTWFRTFLANFLQGGDAPASIDVLPGRPTASARGPFDEAVGYDSGEMRPAEIERLRPEVYLHQARQAAGPIYCKVHDAYTFLPDGRPLLPPAATDCALYFVRNPLDVCVSFAHHAGGREFDRVIARMGDPTFVFCGDESLQEHQLRQRLLTWSGHVTSWSAPPGIRVMVIRYEDMQRRPQAVFAEAARFLGFPEDPNRVARAIAFSRFEELRRQEERGGFVERSPGVSTFFRRGEIGSWRDTLTPGQVDQLITDHAEVMHRLGYLDENRRPLD